MLSSTWRAGLGAAVFAALVLAGCGGDDDARVDAGGAPVDAAARDAGGGTTDAGARDGGGPGADAASSDAGSVDAGARTDGGSSGADAGPRTDGGSSGADAGPTTAICGGIAGAACAATDFCDYPDASMCGGDDSTGVCMVRPMVCPRIFDPACGCDGMDYSNPCEAHGAGTDVAYMGMCTTMADCRTTGCAAGATCNLCRGAGGGVWICLPAGTVC